MMGIAEALADLRPWTELPDTLAQAVSELSGIDVAADEHCGDHPALAWRRSGLMKVTGRVDGPGLVPPVAVTTLADAALAILKQLTGSEDLPTSGALLLGERARLVGLRRQGMISPNGSCRLLACADGMIALNLPREDDWSLAAAMVQEPVADWTSLAATLLTRTRHSMVARGRLLGLAIAADECRPCPAFPYDAERCAEPREAPSAAPLVIDFSALWAGPLAGGLLAAAGARVIKVESTQRPDGARLGHAGFYSLLNDRKEACEFEFSDPDALDHLRGLVRSADIIIEGSRPRALRALGIDAQAEASRGATWLSITAHGREGDAAEAIGFGDDTAVGGGLTRRLRAVSGETLFAGDAIADPLTGIVAALAGWSAWMSGGGQVISLAMANIVAYACGFGASGAGEAAHWQHLAASDRAELYPLRTA